jgi:type VI secretion system secreted protein Hcp
MSSEEATKVVRAGQRLGSRGRLVRVALPTVVALGVGSAVTVAAIPSSDGTITACYASLETDTSNVDGVEVPAGNLRIIDPSHAPDAKGSTFASTCGPSETKITWNQQGPTGPTGPAGPAGAGGVAGAAGVAGPVGAAGQSLVGDTSFGVTKPAGGKLFLKLDGVEGESADAKHKGEIELESVALGGGPATPAGSTAKGKAHPHDFTFTHLYDKASPVLARAAVAGNPIKHASFLVSRKAGGEQKDFLKIDLSSVLVSSVRSDTSSGGTPTETVTLSALKATETFLGHSPTTVNISGTAG